MVDSDPTRRQVSIGLGTALSVALAGCMGDDDGNGNGDENGNGNETENGNGNETENGNGNETENGNGNGTPDPEGSAMLGIAPENGDGEEVTIGIDLTLQHAEYSDQSFERSYVGDFDELVPHGETTSETMAEENEYSWERLSSEPFQIYYTGDWNVTIEANEANDFETVEETIEITEEELTDTGSEELMREVSIVLEGATSDAERERQNAEVIEGQYRIDGNHDPETEWAWGVRDASEEAGAQVEQQEWEEADHQRWDFEPVDEEGKWHRIVAAHTDEELVWNANADTDALPEYESWTNVQIEAWEETEAQRWRIIPITSDAPGVEEGDELYKIKSQSNDAVVYLDIGGRNIGSQDNQAGLPVVTYWYAGEDDQHLNLHEQ